MKKDKIIKHNLFEAQAPLVQQNISNKPILYQDVIHQYFTELIKILDLRLQSLSKSIRGRDAIINLIIPRLLEFIPEFTKVQYIKFLKQTFADFNLKITPFDLKNIFITIRKFETKRDNIISKIASNKKDVELLDNIINFINDVVSSKVEESIILKIYDFLYNTQPDFNPADDKETKKQKVNQLMIKYQDITNKHLSKLNFEDFYNDVDIDALLTFVDEYIDMSTMVQFKNKSLSTILLKMGFNIKSNMILKGLLSDVDNETIELNKKRLLLVFVELFTQLFYPSSLKSGLTYIEKELNKNFSIKSVVDTTESEPEENIFSKNDNVLPSSDIEDFDPNMRYEERLSASIKNATSKIKSVAKDVGVNGVGSLKYNDVLIPVSESAGLIEILVPVDKFEKVKPSVNTSDEVDMIPAWESGGVEKSEENFFIYLKEKGLESSKGFFRYSIAKQYVPFINDIETVTRDSDNNKIFKSRQEDVGKVEIFRQLVTLNSSTLDSHDVKISEVDYTKSDVILPEVEFEVTPEEVISMFEKLKA